MVNKLMGVPAPADWYEKRIFYNDDGFFCRVFSIGEPKLSS
jgi:hypothetical protein